MSGAPPAQGAGSPIYARFVLPAVDVEIDGNQKTMGGFPCARGPVSGDPRVRVSGCWVLGAGCWLLVAAGSGWLWCCGAVVLRCCCGAAAAARRCNGIISDMDNAVGTAQEDTGRHSRGAVACSRLQSLAVLCSPLQPLAVVQRRPLSLGAAGADQRWADDAISRFGHGCIADMDRLVAPCGHRTEH